MASKLSLALKFALFGLVMTSSAALRAQDHSHNQKLQPDAVAQKTDNHDHHKSITHNTKTKAAAALTKALKAKDRPEKDLKRDSDRAAELAFISKHILPGQHILEIGAGGGYMTRILSSLVGENGHVTMQNPQGWIKSFKLDPIMDDLAVKRKNISPLKADFDQIPIPAKPYDVVVSSMIYHDTVWLGVDRSKMNAQTFAAMKPGGIYIVVDHRAEAGSGVRDVETLHRIEMKTVIEEISNSGLIFIHDHNDLANQNDNHTINVFDPAIRGKTDRSLLVFQKPLVQHAH
jgi:predicted methyltransferase